MPFPLQRTRIFSQESILDISPGLPGIYGIYNHLRWIYIGQALDLQRRLLEHYNRTSNQASDIWANRPAYFVAMLVDPANLDAAETALVLEYMPICNK